MSEKIALVVSFFAMLGVLALSLVAYYFYEEQYLVLYNQNIALRAQMTSTLKALSSQNAERAVADLRTELSNFKNTVNQELAALSKVPAFDQQALWEEVGTLVEQIDQLRWKTLGAEVEIVPAKPLTLSNWQSELYSAWEEFKGLIKITRLEQNPIPLTGFVREQAELKNALLGLVIQAQWAVLQKNQKIYTVSLNNIEKLVKDYFVENTEQTDLLAHLHALQHKIELGRDYTRTNLILGKAASE